VNELPYIECDPKGVNPRQDLCEKVPVRAFPTWVIDGQKYEGVMSLDRLAELSKFRYATPTAGRP
jgi:hypothetical protein